MCLDISFRVDDTVDTIYDYLPHLKVDPQLNLDYSTSMHIQAHARLKSRVVYVNSEGYPYLTEMRWGLITKFLLDDPLAMKKYGNNMFNARSEEVFEKRKVWNKLRHQRCLMDLSGIY